MEILNESGFTFATAVGRIGFPAHSLTLIVKGTFALTPGVLEPASEPRFPTGDEPAAGEDAEPLRYEDDFAPLKPKADLLLVGHCVPPEPTEACPVTFRVGGHQRTLAVFGDRHWRNRLLGLAKTRSMPAKFTEMPLTYERAFGGPSHKSNPLGMGVAPGAGGRVSLPNIEDPAKLIASPSDHPEPAGLAPVPKSWPRRAALMGTFRKDYAKTRWPWYPEDFDFAHFNAAPPSMQADYLKGDEEVFLQNIHPEAPEFATRLPGVRVRCLVERRVGGEPKPAEPPMHLDTLWIDADAQVAVLVWRGHVEVEDEDCADVERVLITTEGLKAPPAPLAMPEAPPELAPPEAPVDAPATEGAAPGGRAVDGKAPKAGETGEAAPFEGRKEAAFSEMTEEHAALFERVQPEALFGMAMPPELSSAEQFQQLESFGFDPELIEQVVIGPEELDDESAAPPDEAPAIEPGANLKEADLGGAKLPSAELSGADLSGANLEHADLSGADLSGADLSGAEAPEAKLAGADLSGAGAAEASFAGADLSGADLSGANLAGADLIETNLSGAKLTGADLTGAKLARADLSNANLDDAELAGADLTGAILTACSAQRASLHAAKLSGVQGEGAVFVGADLSECEVNAAQLNRADFTEASLEGAIGESVAMKNAVLAGTRAASASLPGLEAAGSAADGSIWQGADLTGADFSGANLTDADFAGANVTGADFSRASLAEARFRKAKAAKARFRGANLFQASFERADLSRADLTGASLYGAELGEARLDGAVLIGADLTMTKLEGEPVA